MAKTPKRGRPPLPKTRVRSERVTVRMTKAQARTLRRKAKAQDVSGSEWAYLALLNFLASSLQVPDVRPAGGHWEWHDPCQPA